MNTKRVEKKPKAPAINTQERLTRQYLCPGQSSIVFYVPVRGEDGKMVPELDLKGNQRYSGNKPQFKLQLCKFEQLSAKLELTDTFKSLCGYTLRAEDPQYADKLEQLEKMRNDPSNMVMDKSMYERWRNPEAADAVIENRKLKEELADRDDILAKMQADMENLRLKLKEVTGKTE